MKNLQVWAVIALWAVAAGSSLAAGETTLEVYSPGWGRMEVPVTWLDNEPVAVDKSYAEEHPDTVGLQAVAVDNRANISENRRRIVALEDCVDVLEGAVSSNQPPAQSQGGDNQPATAPAGSEVSNMLTIGMFAGTLGALGLLGVLVWIAVLLGRRDENYGLSTLAQALNVGEGEIRGSATAPDGRSVAFRVSGINAEARAATIAAQSGGGAAPAQPAPTPTPAPQPPPGTPAQRAMIRAMLGNAGAAQTDNNVDIVVLVAANQVPPTDLSDPAAINGLIGLLLGQNLLR